MARLLLVAGGTVVTMDRERRLFADGYVLVRDGEITAVGAAADLPDPGEDVERVDATGCIVVPGFVNAHQHHWYALFKGLGAGLLLEDWVAELLLPTAAAITPADLEAAGRLACLEMLSSGTTAFLNHSVTPTAEPEVAATIAPALETGIRQLFAKEIRPERLDEQLALAEHVHGTWNGAGDGRVTIGFVLESTAHWVAMGASSEESILQGHALAGRLNARISDHVAGGTLSRERGYLRAVLETGRTDVELLHLLGVLDERWLLAHAIHARDRDVELIADAGACVVHTPTSESSRAGGIAQVRRFREAGIVVGLGTDGPMVDTSVDMLEQMKAVRLFQNQLHGDPAAITAADALALGTIDSARCVGLDDLIGSLEPGKAADLVVFGLDGLATAVCHDPVGLLVHSLRGRDARAVVVAGEVLVRDGRFTRFDAAAVRDVIDEARRRSHELLQRSGAFPVH
jgi:5-methylthioadenosine/S-adenosylhomocysteine deaminase